MSTLPTKAADSRHRSASSEFLKNCPTVGAISGRFLARTPEVEMAIFGMMGFAAALETVGIGADYSMTSRHAGANSFDLATYAYALGGCATNMMQFERERGPLIANLSQARSTSRQTMSMHDFSDDVPTAEEFRSEMRKDPHRLQRCLMLARKWQWNAFGARYVANSARPTGRASGCQTCQSATIRRV